MSDQPDLTPGADEPVPQDANVSAETQERRAKQPKGKKKKSAYGSARGVETMFRTSYMVNMQLSSLADAKANIMISINGFILSILLASISSGIARSPWLLMPSAVLLLSCLVSIVYAVLAARPRISKLATAAGSPELPSGHPVNLLFFGHYAGMDVLSYERAMTDLISDIRKLYPVMIRDLHGLGTVLQRKFSLIRRSYDVFMFGLIAGVVLFLLAFVQIALDSTRVL